MVKESGLTWTIFRLAAALPVRLVLDSDMFDVPLDNRIEFVHTRDVGLAIANGVRSILVGPLRIEIGREAMTLNISHRCQYPFVADTTRFELLHDHLFALIRESRVLRSSRAMAAACAV